MNQKMNNFKPSPSPVVDEEVGESKLMGIEDEGCNTQGNDRYPEVDQVRRPQCQSGVEKHEQSAHAQVDAGSSETRVEDVERNPSGSETTTSCDVTSATKRQIAQDRVCLDLGGENFEDRRK